ncbi:MAG TPA: hypothetical protein VLT47_15200 [Anaeromyxobacteraceae bacterium]|nr:hypothetical protein [Anaeromyxobacteraceae bacterium]
MPGRRGAREQEEDAAASSPPVAAPVAPLPEPLAMLRRRGLDPRRSRPDLPFDPGLPRERLDAIAARLHHYAFRLFLRGAILHREGFTPEQATRYLPADGARALAEGCVADGIAERRPGGRYRLLHPARSFGGTLEWWLARELATRLSCETAYGIRSGARGLGGDIDVVAALEGKLLYVEAKSSPPKHVTVGEITAFLQRIEALRPDVTLFVVDSALRLSDKILPLFAEAFDRLDVPPPAPRRLFRETWALTPHLFLVNAKEDLIDNVCRAVAAGLRSLAPEAACPTSTSRSPAKPPSRPSRRRS